MWKLDIRCIIYTRLYQIFARKSIGNWKTQWTHRSFVENRCGSFVEDRKSLDTVKKNIGFLINLCLPLSSSTWESTQCPLYTSYCFPTMPKLPWHWKPVFNWACIFVLWLWNGGCSSKDNYIIVPDKFWRNWHNFIAVRQFP